jgi:hypothetical protein
MIDTFKEKKIWHMFYNKNAPGGKFAGDLGLLIV